MSKSKINSLSKQVEPEDVTLSKPVYIPSIEASEIYNYLYREGKIELEYIGMIPRSLEMQKLLSVGLIPDNKKTAAKLDKLLSDDVINVKFSQNVKTGEEVIRAINIKLEVLVKKESKLDEEEDRVKADKSRQKLIEYRDKLNGFVKQIEADLNSGNVKRIEKWNSVKKEDLRTLFYENSFTYNNVKYVVYKRSSAKSRIGQCLFVREDLHSKMIEWSRMNIPFHKQPEEVKVDFPSLLAYESLVGSSIESTIYIHPKNILIVRDVESKFMQLCNVIRKGDPLVSKRGKIKKGSERLDSFTENAEIKNSLFDGSSLLDSRYFTEGKAMALLRNHMMKTCSFSTNIQDYYRNECPDDINYDEWQIPNMFGQYMYAKDVHLLITPSSLKALKFFNVFGLKPTADIDMWEHWKQIVVDDGCMFGVCKNEKKSKHGGNQQMSYQMVNSLPLDHKQMKKEMTKLSKFEHDYIAKLKNDDDSFVSHIRKNANSINSNAMFADLYDRNSSIVRTKVFRKFRAKEIHNHVEFVKRGKIRLSGDYLVMLGNGMEYLAHSIGKLDISKPVLKGNEIYTTRFKFDTELTGFRNPHTSPSNILVAKNTDNEDIDTYFNFTDNIVMVNAIEFPICDILSSCDWDSDTCLFIEDEHLLSISKRAFGKYKVCINHVDSEPRTYKVCNEDMATIDNELSKSQFLIGEVVNLGQWALSAYWDLLSKGKTEKELEGLLKKIDVISILSCICIDLAKKFFDINIKSEIANIRKVKELKKEIKIKVEGKEDKTKFITKEKPLFWKVVAEDNKEEKLQTIKYQCPMDYLFESLTGLKYADKRTNLELAELITKENYRSADRKQQVKIITYVADMCTNINKIKAKKSDQGDDEETNIAIDNLMKYCEYQLSKLTVDEDTMYSLLLKIAENKKDDIVRKLLTMLHRTQKETFIEGFKNKNSTN